MTTKNIDLDRLETRLKEAQSLGIQPRISAATGLALIALARQQTPVTGNPSGLIALLNTPKRIDAYARQLAMSLWRTHYSETSPNFELLDDTHGVLTQIDNMLTGLTPATHQATLAAPAEQMSTNGKMELLGMAAEEAAHYACRYGDPSLNFYILRDRVLASLKSKFTDAQQASPPKPAASQQAGAVERALLERAHRVLSCAAIVQIRDGEKTWEDIGNYLASPAATTASASTLSDAEFLSKRLARVAKLAGVPMPSGSHEDIAAVAGTILGSIAYNLERAAQASHAGAVSEQQEKVVPPPRGTGSQHDAGASAWINVDQRLPEDDTEVIILYWPYDNRDNKQIAGHAHFYDGCFWAEDWNPHHPPSHWMPLPPVPDESSTAGAAKGGENNDNSKNAATTAAADKGNQQ